MSSSDGKSPPPDGGAPRPGAKRPGDTTVVVQIPVKGEAAGELTAIVTVLTGQDAGVVFELKSGVSDMGRGSDVDIPLADAGLSRRHARIIASAGVYTIEDLGSTNGTFLNGVKVTDRVSMESGARIQVVAIRPVGQAGASRRQAHVRDDRA
jgi:pSer/pThr/pTyr-binding forkhead associated (FHA) protein